MKIKYSKKRLFSNLFLGALFTVFGIAKTLEGTANYFNYFQLILGVLLVVSFFFERHNQYLKIENGILTKNSLKRKSVKLIEVIHIRSLPGKIKVFTSEKNLTFNTGIIDDDSIKDLYPVLGSLELELQENSFIGWSKTKS